MEVGRGRGLADTPRWLPATAASVGFAIVTPLELVFVIITVCGGFLIGGLFFVFQRRRARRKSHPEPTITHLLESHATDTASENTPTQPRDSEEERHAIDDAIREASADTLERLEASLDNETNHIATETGETTNERDE